MAIRWANVALYPGGAEITFGVKSKGESIQLCELWKFAAGNPGMVSLQREGGKRVAEPGTKRVQRQPNPVVPAILGKIFHISNGRERESIIYANPSNSNQKRYKSK